MRLPLLVFHISAGVRAMFAGVAAMSFRKGSGQHGVAGNVFVVSMLIKAMAASWLAYMKHQTNNVFGGLLHFYMVATAWATARRRDEESGILDWVGFLFAFGIGLLGLIHGIQEAIGTRASVGGVPVFMDIFMSSVILLAAGRPTHARAWNLRQKADRTTPLAYVLFGWFIATGSFFLVGHQQVFPHHGVGHLGS